MAATSQKCENCGAGEWVKDLGLCAPCYLSAGFHASGIVHECDKHCPREADGGTTD